jgi:hypothetical protein
LLIIIQEHHGDRFRQFQLDKAASIQGRPHADPVVAHDEPPAKKYRQQESPVTTSSGSGTTRRKVSQSDFESHLVNMLLEDMMPLAAVERSGFKKFCQSIIPSVTIPCRRTVVRRVNDMYDCQKTALVEQLKSVDYVSCTADLWSSHKRSFLGMTVHYIDQLTIERRSHALICRHFAHSHKGERIAEMIADVSSEFGLTEKTVDILTDNAANMVKAFKLLPDLCKESALEEGPNDESICENEDNLETVDFVSINEAVAITYSESDRLQDDQCEDRLESCLSSVQLVLKQKRCANHTLNLVAAVDALSARDN